MGLENVRVESRDGSTLNGGGWWWWWCGESNH
jgi:hypothetical protein